MTNLPIIPPTFGVLPKITVEKPDTTREDTEAAKEAWLAAKDAIMAAWKITPKHMLNTRRSIRRGEFNQGIAEGCANAMIDAANHALWKLRVADQRRESGHPDVPATDAEVIAGEGN